MSSPPVTELTCQVPEPVLMSCLQLSAVVGPMFLIGPEVGLSETVFGTAVA